MTIGEIDAVVRRAIEQGRIGAAVVVRMHAFLSSAPEKLVEDTAAILARCGSWLTPIPPPADSARAGSNGDRSGEDRSEAPPGSDLVLLHALGSAAAGHLVALARTASGRTVLVRCATRFDGPARLEFLVLGTHGSLRHEASINAGMEPVGIEPADHSAAAELARRLADALASAGEDHE